MRTHVRMPILALALFGLILIMLPAGTAQQPTPAAADSGEGVSDLGWPRTITGDDFTLTVYQPQVEKWSGNQLEARAAVAIQKQSAPRPTYGVIWMSARTEVDKESRMVILQDVSITKGNFPVDGENAASYLNLIRQSVPVGVKSVSLDRLQASLAVTQAESQPKRVELKNQPPRIIYTKKPSVLVLVDGQPALRETGKQQMLRVINTRSLILLDQGSGKYYLRLLNQWLAAAKIEGPWAKTENVPAAAEDIKNTLANSGVVDLMDNPAPDIKDALDNGKFPDVYVSTVPAELLETEGDPQFQPIDGTTLLYVPNSPDEIVVDTNTQYYWTLLSGRWFRSKSLTDGPWQFVASNDVPADFAKIPPNHPKGDLLSAVAGTPQSEEAVIANQVPQTATIKRSEARLAPTYDGEPQFKPVEGTALAYAVNTPTPVIRVNPTTYYACENGVWFTASSPNGPWTAATSVPQSIYTIPASSPINYVTNVQVYGSTPEYVYTGYTPGYFGTYVSPWNTVVYGSGYTFVPWIGTVWYGMPWTYGFGANVGWGIGGWGLGFGVGIGWPWWGPVGWHHWWGGNWWNRGWEHGWGGRYNNIHGNNINFNNTNIYNRWNNSTHINNFKNAQFGGNRNVNIGSGNRTINNIERGHNNVFAGHDGNVFRRNEGNWEQHTDRGWQTNRPENFAPERRNDFNNFQRNLDRQFDARRLGEGNFNSFRNAGGFGGYRAPEFRGGGFGRGGFHGGGRRR